MADGPLRGGRGIDGTERQGHIDLASFCVNGQAQSWLEEEGPEDFLEDDNGLQNHPAQRRNKRDDHLAWQSMAELLPGILENFYPFRRDCWIRSTGSKDDG